MFSLCPPTIIYIIFSITHVIIDSFNGLYNTALMKMIVMIMISLLLNILCEKGLAIIAWFIVFIPIIMMTVIATLLLYYFGINLKSGDLNVPDDTEKNKNRELLFKEHPTIINLPNNKVRDSRYSSGLMYVS